LYAAAATAGGILIADTAKPKANSVTFLSKEGSTEHFWYRPQPDGPYIDSQRDNKAFGFTDRAVYLSEDNARTWPHSMAFENAANITFSTILGNGNILFATRTKLYLSTDNLKTCRRITVKDTDGSDYIPHKPKNPGTSTHSTAFICGTLTVQRCLYGVITAMSSAVLSRSTFTIQQTTAGP
jgi:hypothetical protein